MQVIPATPRDFKAPRFSADTLVVEANEQLEAVGVDVGYKTFACLSTGQRLTRGDGRSIARYLARLYKIVCTEARYRGLEDFFAFFDALDEFCPQFKSRHISVAWHYPSTRRCSSCGRVHSKVTTDIRFWRCTKCNTLHDRDVNAAKNILTEGLKLANCKC